MDFPAKMEFHKDYSVILKPRLHLRFYQFSLMESIKYISAELVLHTRKCKKELMKMLLDMTVTSSKHCLPQLKEFEREMDFCCSKSRPQLVST